MPVLDCKQDECPVSIISRHPQMDAMVTEVFNMQRVKEFTGSVPFGLDCSEWPSRWYDAVRIAKIEEDRAESAKDEVRDGKG